MVVIFLLLLIGGLVCFLLTAFGVASRVNLLGLGLALWIAVDVIQKARQLN
jgi:hypothetical protein